MLKTPLIAVLASVLFVNLSAVGAPAQTAAPGLTLFNPNVDTNTYLMDTNGQIVHTWSFAGTPGITTYLEEDGTLLRAKKISGPVSFGGSGGGVERVAFDGTVLWDFTISNAQEAHHHEALPLPNGNVLVLVWPIMTNAEALAAGRDPALLNGSGFFPEAIVEYQQTGQTTATEVWRWDVMDHVVQDFDPTKPNFGVVANHPELVDLNFAPNGSPGGEWLHANAINYDPVFDQILFSTPFLNELWVIDHSTTTAEAAGSTGGNSGKGGDLLYRWGNPEAYGAGTAADQKLFFQHGGMFIEPGRPGAGNILVFNNEVPGPPQHSEVWELTRQADSAGNYTLAPGAAFGPAAPVWSYAAPMPADLNSTFLSSAERLPNGNTMINSGAQAWFFEVTNAGTKVWEHFNTLPVSGPKVVFKTRRYERYLFADRHELSAAAGGSVGFNMVTGTDHAGELYLLLGSISGTTPGLVVDGLTLPLVVDAYFLTTLTQPNQPPLSQSFGVLDALGKASASFALPGGLGVAGITANHAFVAFDPVAGQVTLVSNAQALSLLP